MIAACRDHELSSFILSTKHDRKNEKDLFAIQNTQNKARVNMSIC